VNLEITRIGVTVTAFDSLRESLSLESAGLHSWRVCDCRVSGGQGRFLAFIEEKNGLFEVMQLGDVFVWTSFATIDDALTHIVETAAAYVTARPDREFSWIK
jgi:hypothetical protein